MRRPEEAMSPSYARFRSLGLGGDPYQNLASSIVAVAADDYRTALEDGNTGEILFLERFFMSRYFQILTSADGGMMIKAIRRDNTQLSNSS